MFSLITNPRVCRRICPDEGYDEVRQIPIPDFSTPLEMTCGGMASRKVFARNDTEVGIDSNGLRLERQIGLSDLSSYKQHVSLLSSLYMIDQLIAGEDVSEAVGKIS